jgi:iron complex transport system ATP-binding protein
MKRFDRMTLSRHVAFVPQVHRPVFAYDVLDMVLMGRTAHVKNLGMPSKKDSEIAMSKLESLHIADLYDKPYTQISGGQQQMVLIARALAQEADILIMDEPTASLDYGNQIKVLTEVRSLSKQGLSVIMTTHFPDHAFLVATQTALMQYDGRFEIGEANDIVTEPKLGEAYGINVKIAHTLSDEGEKISGCIPLLGVQKVTQFT